jgi:hypothetical protein
MRTVSLCPFSVGTLFWQDQKGSFTLSVCAKGTFLLLNDREAALSELQEPISEARFVDDDPLASLYAPADLVPFKPRADIVVVGHAYAPEERPVDALVARFSVGGLSKTIGVVGDRVWTEGPDGLEPGPPVPFTKMALRFERAARGPDNPVGVDLTRVPTVSEAALPNLETVDDAFVDGRVVGCGPIPPGWAARRALLDPDAWRWADDRAGPAPASFNFGFYNAAPRDQQVDLLRHGSIIALENLNRTHPRLETRLPLVRAKAFLVSNTTDPPAREHASQTPIASEAGRQGALEVAMRCDTVWIDTDREIVTVTWRGLVGVEHPDVDATLVVAAESKGRTLRYKQIERMLRDGVTSSMGDQDEPNVLGKRHDTIKIKAADVGSDVAPDSWASSPSMPFPDTDDGVWEELSGSNIEVISLSSPQGAAVQRPPFDEPSVSAITEVLAGRVQAPWPAPAGFHGSARDEPTLVTEDSAPTQERTVSERPSSPRPLEVADYARITVGIERGEVGRVLNEFGLGLADLATLRAAWKKRLDGDPTLVSEFERAMARARVEGRVPSKPEGA